jgi:peroxiredoxin
VLVGLMGKVLGPLGMAQALWTGALPWRFAVNCVTNDVIWWLPFALILKFNWDQYQSEPGLDDLPDETTLLTETGTNTGASLAELSRGQSVLLVFLRHAGCTFCRQAMTDLASRRKSLAAEGVEIALVHMGTPESFAKFAEGYGLADVPAVSDPERRLYRGLGLRRGTLRQILGWSVLARGARAFFSGHGAGMLQGDGLQLPGAFVIRDGRVVRRFLHATSADRPDYVELCQLPTSPNS